MDPPEFGSDAAKLMYYLVGPKVSKFVAFAALVVAGFWAVPYMIGRVELTLSKFEGATFTWPIIWDIFVAGAATGGAFLIVVAAVALLFAIVVRLSVRGELRQIRGDMDAVKADVARIKAHLGME